MKRFIILIVILSGLGGLGYTLRYLYKKNEQKPVVYSTEHAFTTDIINKTVATGSIVPRKEVEIKPQVSGIVEKLFVEAGDEIKKGQTIAKVKIIPDMINLNNAKSRVEQAKISVEDAKLNFDRQEKLFKESVIAEAEFQRFRINYEKSLNELKAAEDNLQLIKEGATAKVGEASNTIIRSTVDGMVLDVPIKQGNSVIESNTFNDGTTIAVVADMHSMIFEGKIDESEVGKLQVGMELLLSIGAIENEKFKANLEYIAPKGEEENGAIQFEIRASVELKEDVFIRAGYSANADIVLEKRPNVLAIKEGLLNFAKDSVFVEVETSEQNFEKRLVKTGLSDGINIEILDGITIQDNLKGRIIDVDEKKKSLLKKRKKK